MTLFELLAVLTTATAALSWANYRFVKLPTTIGLLILALLGSLVIVLAGRAGLLDLSELTRFVESLEFDDALLNGMLGALLFAGALHMRIDKLRLHARLITVLATFGVVMCAALVAGAMWLLFRAIGFPVPMAWCLVLGALIAPTDPIAVGAILGKVGVPKSLSALISGESLFNDGVAVVLFLVLVGLAAGTESATAVHIAELFAIEVGGGLAFGGLLGWLATRMMRGVDQYQLEILLTLAVVTGGYALAQRLHISGALAMVVAGLMIGSTGRATAMSLITQERLDEFWELIDEFLNAVLFVLIGIEVVIVDFRMSFLLAGMLGFPIVLLARWLSVGLPLIVMRRRVQAQPGTLTILTWAGLRGGISVALALSLPPSEYRSLILTVTYVIVCLSIVGQGLTVGAVVQRVLQPSHNETDGR
ncbi:MAG: sodium:proton antiporter [Gemmatimonadaceae bacterium]|jgi:CPA1 family monovalent cation:H+ antiporter|nr:sodium:proton antiporter [Gemmatimonadaceae bacterium]